MNDLEKLTAEAHASRKIIPATPEGHPGHEGFIAEVRSTGFATEKEAFLIKLVVPDHKPGWFRFSTATATEASYNFGKRILSDLHSKLQAALAIRSQTQIRVFLHSQEGAQVVNELIGLPVLITAKRGQSDGKGGNYPDEYIPNPKIRTLLTKEEAELLLEQTTTTDLGSFE